MKVDPRVEPDWTSRNWEEEARTASAVLKNFPELVRHARQLLPDLRHLLSDDQRRHDHPHLAQPGRRSKRRWTRMPMTACRCTIITPLTAASRPICPMPRRVGKGSRRPARQLMQLRASPLVPDYTGPVLFDAPAAASMLAQVLAAVTFGRAAAAFDDASSSMR